MFLLVGFRKEDRSMDIENLEKVQKRDTRFVIIWKLHNDKGIWPIPLQSRSIRMVQTGREKTSDKIRPNI